MHCRGKLASSRFLTRGRLLLLCLLALLACNVSPCSASCGDYLLGHPAPGSVATPQGTDQAQSQPVPRCDGPHCQRDDRAPVTPHKLIQIPRSADLILTSVTLLVRSDCPSAILFDQAETVTVVANRLFRPPRGVLLLSAFGTI